MKKKLNNGWTCIDDDMPPDDFQVLVINDLYPELIYVAERREDGCFKTWFHVSVHPTHWQYLPPPPEYKGELE